MHTIYDRAMPLNTVLKLRIHTMTLVELTLRFHSPLLIVPLIRPLNLVGGGLEFDKENAPIPPNSC